MQKQKLFVALVGYGYWGKRLFKTLKKFQSVSIVAVCDKNQRVLNGLQSLGSGVQFVTNKYRDVVSNKDINAVVIATPQETHYQIAKASLQSGKHVLLEKPMTTKKRHARTLNKLADKNKLILMIDHTYLYAPEIRAAKQIIGSGALGDIRLIETARAGPGQYKHDCDVIWDFAPHDISILYYLLGIPIELSAIHSCKLNQHRIDISNLSFKFANGCDAYVYLSWLSPIKLRRILIIGAKKTLMIEQTGITSKIDIYSNSYYLKQSNQTDKYRRRVKNVQRLSGLPYSEPLRNVCHEFVQSISGRTQPLSNGHLGYKIVSIMLAIHRLQRHSSRLTLN
ncbi:hypothetical protein A2V80_02895 [Candidatus Woesebacteria bacterium RBG_16_39_8b]|uniref:Uncharacterized protein n=1 Tax=Candidatus Woesebacteria bacterium RBG_16_39_8b TaxID=1802482 RepID=A0A1F7XAZ3_9BACT|nr:MAG: hypothetical protein A2V80_02895 [Candidatus Woesebacteria bacterium RBG_16_39_8b]